MFAATVLAASLIGITGGATQQQQVNAAGALWRILIRVQATGDFRTADGGVASVINDDHGLGSGVMVSPDGFLLTVAHVIDPNEIARDACTLGLKKEYVNPVLKRLRVDFILSDIAGNEAVGRVTMAPYVTDANICDDPSAVSWLTDPGMPVRIEAIDALADLALMKLDIRDAQFVPVSSPVLSEHDPVYAFGWVEDDKFVKAAGTFVRWCERVTDIEDTDGTVHSDKPELLMRIMAPVKEGMSGGPILSGDALAGIATISADFDGTPGGYGIPAAYVQAWYRWVTGASPVRPATVCEQPFIPPEQPKSK